ncbi:hypothetical protein K2X05_07290, partial [bacterium]|nr:hypothetical protein [bacterium]
MSRFSLFLFHLSLAFAFTLGVFSKESSTNSRNPAQIEKEFNYESYENIPCPSPVEMSFYIENAHFKNPTEPLVCDTSYQGKVFKIFKLASLLEVDLPKDWTLSHNEIFTNTFKYISKSTSELVISDSNPRAIASNYAGQSIHLGPAFFEIPPLKALEILVHENRHSNLNDPKHTLCRTGDIAKTDYGCDEEYSKGIYTGAYSIGTLWSIAFSFFGKKLGPMAKQEMFNSAISMISTRFNKVPEGLAVPLDLLFVLGEDHKVYQLHPFTFEPKLIDLEIAPEDMIDRIQFDPLENGFLAFTQMGKIIEFSSSYKQIPFYSDILPKNKKFIDSNKVFTASSKSTPSYFVTDDGTVYMKEFGIDKVTAYLKNLSFVTKKIFHALYQNLFLLSLDGKLYTLDTSGKGPTGRIPKIFGPTQSHMWVDATGGATYDDLYAVNAIDGSLYHMTFHDSDPNFQIQKSDFTTPEPLIKFQEGLNIRAALSEKNNLFVWDYSRSTENPWQIPIPIGIKDFALSRKYALTSEPATQKLSAWGLNCQLQVIYREPWLNTQIGLDAKSDLYFEGLGDQPCLSQTDFYKRVSSTVQLRGSVLGKTQNYFSQTYLEFLKKN